jgi:cytoskeletal protein CcmA (bactofilin family)
MGITQFSRNRGEARSANSRQGAEAGAGAIGLTTFIGEDVEFEGTLRAKDTLRIEGRIRGQIKSDNTVIIGQNADVEADIQSKNVIIIGALSGNVDASRQLVVNKSGRLKGNVSTPSLVIEPGALFNGRTKMVRPEVAAQAKTAEAESKPLMASGKPVPTAAKASGNGTANRKAEGSAKTWRPSAGSPPPTS